MIELTGRGIALVLLALCACSGDLGDQGESYGDLGFLDGSEIDAGTRPDGTAPRPDAPPATDAGAADTGTADASAANDAGAVDARPRTDLTIGTCDSFSVSLNEQTQRTCDNLIAERVSDCETTGGTWTGDRLCQASGDRWVGAGVCNGDCAQPSCVHYSTHPKDTDKAACDAVLQLRKTDCLAAGCSWVGATACQVESVSNNVTTYGGQGICL